MTWTFPVFGPYRTWDGLRSELAGRVPDETLAALDDAVEFAVERHGDQRRPAGEPYLEHLLETVGILVHGPGVTDRGVLVAAVLHDVVEDTGTSLAEVREEFGEDVAGLVAWVTKPDARPGEPEDAARRRYLDSLAQAPERALWLKLADRLSNVQRLETHPRPEKRASYYEETVACFLPLAAEHPWYEQWYAAWQAGHA
ncbi:HD domain-containing protein [Actinomadura sp. DC4]|uniref:HD domain-containing protein n=1 Tax=Actinomadura sp. DC4 TaxID=3055069 RepID=UPI0025AFD114|nr:HD domain-containing protein [Actinomadura sp. DC4]MDN3360038.1 HD domain-containing protein [Actinomadura sp. DC4]